MELQPRYWSFSLSIRPSNEYSGLISFRIDWFDFLAVNGLSNIPLSYIHYFELKATENQQTQEKLKKWRLCLPLVKGISTYKISTFKGRNFGQKKM